MHYFQVLCLHKPAGLGKNKIFRVGTSSFVFWGESILGVQIKHDNLRLCSSPRQEAGYEARGHPAFQRHCGQPRPHSAGTLVHFGDMNFVEPRFMVILIVIRAQCVTNNNKWNSPPRRKGPNLNYAERGQCPYLHRAGAKRAIDR